MTRRRRTRAYIDGRRDRTDGAQGSGSAAATGAGPLRIALFGVIAVAVIGLAGFVLVDRLQGPPTLDATAIRVNADMGGFDPGDLTVTAGETVRIEFASLDTAYHSDGGGWHQFAIDELGIDWQVGPKSSQLFTFVAPDQPGRYAFYCDICCGGKENPSMQGTLTVTA